MIYNSHWPHSIKMDLRKEIKQEINEHQAEYILKLHRRMYQVYAALELNLTEEIRYLWYKELLAIFNEISKIKIFKRKIEGFEQYHKDLISLVDFIRNLTFHFPYFSKWNDVAITYNQAFSQQQNEPGRKDSNKERNLALFLNPQNVRKPFFLRLNFYNGYKVEDKINFPEIDSRDHLIFLKDVINEFKGLKCIIAVMEYTFNLFMVRSQLSPFIINVNNSFLEIDRFVKRELKSLGKKPLHRFGYVPRMNREMFRESASISILRSLTH